MEFTNNQKQVFKQVDFRVILSVTLMAVLGVASVAPVFPSIQEEFNITKDQVSLLVTFFTLPGIFLTPFLGMLADRFGRKEVLIPSLFLFGLAGGLCGFSRSFEMLLVFRFLQGMGGASLNSINVTLIGDLYHGKTRAAAMGYNASILSIGTAAYPAIGGTLALLGWNFPFFLPLLAIPIGIISIFYMKSVKPENGQTLKAYFKEAWQRIKDRQILSIFFISISTFIILYGCYISFFPFLLDEKFNASSVFIGILMSTMSLSTAITSSQLDKLISRFTIKQLLLFAFILFFISLILLPVISNKYLIIFPIAIFGAALGLTVPNMHTLLAELTPKKHRAIMMSINGMVLRGGQTLGPVIIGFVYASFHLTATFFAGALMALLVLPLIYTLLK